MVPAHHGELAPGGGVPATTTGPLRPEPGDARFQQLTAAIFDGLCITRRGRIIEINEQFAAMFRCRREDVIGREVLDFVELDSRAVVSERIRAGHEGIYEHRALRPDGTSIEVEVRAKTIEWDGEIARVSAVRDISERKRVDAALRESRARLELIFHNTTDMLLLYAVQPAQDGALDLRLVTLNRAFLEGAARAGYPTSLEALRGRTYIEIMRDHFEREESWIAASCEQIRMAIVARQPMRWVDEAVGRGGFYALERTEIPIFDEDGSCRHVLRVLHDVSEYRLAQEALRASEQRFRSYFELPIVGLAISSPGQVWTTVNDRLCELLGYSQQELLGRSWRDLTHPDDLAANQDLFDRVLAGELEGYTFEKRFVRKDGTVIPTALSSRCVRRPDGRIDYLVTLIQDISERKRAEAERAAARAREQRTHREFTRRLIASQETERRRIASELHDSLGQNLLLIKNRVQLAQAAAPAAGELGTQLAGIAQLAAAAIAEVRQISHDLRPYQLDQLGLTRALRAMIDTAAGTTHVAFEHKLEPVDEVFSADNAIHLYRIVQECLTNILKHARAGKARLILERDLHEVRLLVADDGCWPADHALGPGSDAGGFGLQNLAERVQILGGQVSLGSAGGRGLAVRVTIPIAEPE